MNELMGLIAVREFWPALEHLFEKAHPRTGWYNYLAEQASQPENSIPLDEKQFQQLAYAQFAGPVLADLGTQRTIDFRALGVRWIFTFKNSRTTALTAEGFCAAFQVLVADITRLDPVITKTTVRASIEVAVGSMHDADDVHIDDSEHEIKAHIRLSDDSSDFDSVSRTMVATAFQLLGPVHVRPADELYALLEPLIRDGIAHKLTAVRPYQESADLMSEEHYERCATAERPSSSAGFEPIENVHWQHLLKQGPAMTARSRSNSFASGTTLRTRLGDFRSLISWRTAAARRPSSYSGRTAGSTGKYWSGS